MNARSDEHATEETRDAELIRRARDGDGEALGRLVEACRDYLLLIANQDLDRDLRNKIGPSDIVQDSLLAVHENFDQFNGSTRSELLAWIRGILVNDLRQARRKFKTDKRKVDREAPLDGSQAAAYQPADSLFTPGTNASVQEEAAMLRAAMEHLPADYRTVLALRNWEQKSFAEIGEAMDKSADATRKLWSRAILELERILRDPTEPPTDHDRAN